MDKKKSLYSFIAKYTKKSVQSVFPMKNRDLLHYAHNVFFGGGLLQDFLGTFDFWTFIFVHFRRAMPFLFDDYIREITYNKGYKERTHPHCGNTNSTYKTILYYTNRIYFPLEVTY